MRLLAVIGFKIVFKISLLEVFDVQICIRALTNKKCKGDNLIKKKYIFINYHKVIYSIPSISCPTLELLAVTDFVKICKGQ